MEIAQDQPKPPGDEAVKTAFEVWKKCIDAQQHFNDLCLRVRNYAITVVGILLGGLAFTYQNHLEVAVLGYKFPASLAFVVAAAFAWFNFFRMDRWYHSFLEAAVEHTEDLEGTLASALPGIGLSKAIRAASAMGSTARLRAFYLWGFFMLALIFVGLLLAKPVVTSSPGAVGS
jgi:hypothetical protein